MKIPHTKIIRLTMPFCVFFILFACSKDTDLLADYVVADTQEARLLASFVRDDIFFSTTSEPVTLDVLSNDVYDDVENVKIIDVSTPTNGTVVINEDKTLTYTPNTSTTETQDNGQNDSQSVEEPETTEETETPAEEEAPTQEETATQEETPTQEKTNTEEPSTTSQETSTEEETTDTFTYTSETTNEDESTTTNTGTVTVTNDLDYGTLKAFPTAYGAGSNATGGRGGSVYRVTNLNNSGVGSFRDAVSKSNRYIVFAVSGTVRLTSKLIITSDNLTIAGQTAPEGGISITGPRVRFVDVDNMIIRYVRFRPIWDHAQWDINDALECTRVTNSVFDHLSICWGADETVSFVGSSGSSPNKMFATYNISFQYNLLGDSAKGMIVGYSNYQDKNTIGTTGGDFSVNSNVFTHISHRFPNPITDDRVDVINNVVHDWRNKFMAMNPPSKININIINNFLQRGKQTNQVASKGKVVQMDYDVKAAQSIYATGNIVDGEFMNPNADNLPLFHWWTQGPSGNTQSNPTGTLQVTNQNSSGRFTNTPYPQLGHAFDVLSAQESFNTLPDEVGASAVIDFNGKKIKGLDAIDAEFITNVKNNTGISHNYYQDRSKTSRYINYYNSVSTIPRNVHPEDYDTDNDGMPDVWEVATFGNLDQEGTGDFNSDGYDNIEQFINLIDF